MPVSNLTPCGKAGANQVVVPLWGRTTAWNCHGLAHYLQLYGINVRFVEKETLTMEPESFAFFQRPKVISELETRAMACMSTEA